MTTAFLSSNFKALRNSSPLFFVWFFSVLLIISRRPDAILNPQFWAEDGAVWYAQAYNLGGFHSLFLSHSAYFQTFPRLAAAFAQIFPLSLAPLIFNLIAIAIQSLPPVLITSLRFESLIPSFALRLYLAFLYIGLPSTSEVFANITNSQWHLALLACLVILATPNSHLGWRVFDLLIIFLSSLTGPFCIILVPITAILWWYTRDRWRLVLLTTLGFGAFIQATTVLLYIKETRALAPLGASLPLLTKILAGKVFLAAFVGEKAVVWFCSSQPYYLHVFLPISITFLGIALWTGYSRKAPFELRLFILFTFAVLVFSLASPTISAETPQWYTAACRRGAGSRYWFLPKLSFIATLVWIVSINKLQAKRLVIIVALVSMLLAISQWRYRSYPDLNFREYATAFTQSSKGSKFAIPINPGGWSMILVKKSD